MSREPTDETPRPTPQAHAIGQDLSTLSLAELDERIAQLRAEVARLEATRAAKDASRSAADAVFKL